MRYLALLTLALALSACQPKEYICSQDRECPTGGGQPGRCLDNHCAFFDPDCPTMLRFDDTAGDNSDECVDPTVIGDGDAGVPTDDGGGAD